MDKIQHVLSNGFVRMELFDVWRGHKQPRSHELIFNHIFGNYDLHFWDEALRRRVLQKLQNLCTQFRRKWIACNRMLERFISVHKTWLDGKLAFNFNIVSQEGYRNWMASTSVCPSKPFADCSESVKRKKIQHLLKNYTYEELAFATQMSLREQGKRDTAQDIAQVASMSPITTNKMKNLVSSAEEIQPTKIVSNNTLALYADNRFTKQQYIAVKQLCKVHNADIFPCYNELLNTKKQCYPDNLIITEDIGEIELQALLNHTIKRLVSVQSTVINQVNDISDVTVYFKWGCNGASGQSNYKQVFSNPDADDSLLFTISLVPLQMKCAQAVKSGDKDQELLLWQNPTPSSTKYCRPIKIMFRRESKELVREEVGKIQEQIKNLIPTILVVGGKEICFHSKLQLTMVDGKICTNLANTPMQNCYICGATPKQMNDVAAVRQMPINSSLLSFGISSLYAWIKCFECIMHIAYRLEVRTWQIKKVDKENVNVRKRHIQDRFCNEMGLLIEIPKPGFGSINDGNTARTFFENPIESSNITGVNKQLITRFSTILSTITCGFSVDSEAFEKYCLSTAHLYLNEYSWYYMPRSIHKILLHGGQIIRASILPIGQMSEEAQEARNKDIKYFRELNTRRFSRLQTMEDMMHMLLISSDPLISSLRSKGHRKSECLPNDVLALLETPTTMTY